MTRQANGVLDFAGYAGCSETVELLTGASALYRSSDRPEHSSVPVIAGLLTTTSGWKMTQDNIDLLKVVLYNDILTLYFIYSMPEFS